MGILGRAIDYIGELETKNQEAAEKDGNYKRGEETARACRGGKAETEIRDLAELSVGRKTRLVKK